MGKRVDVWWNGDGAFRAASVTGYNAERGATGYSDAAAGTHVLRYDSGLRVLERLEFGGEPQLWRLRLRPTLPLRLP